MLNRQLLRSVLSRVEGGAFKVRWWDGIEDSFGSGPPLFTLVLRDPSVMGALETNPEKGFSDAYIDGRIDVEGDLTDLTALAVHNSALADGTTLGRAVAATSWLQRRRSLKRQREDAQKHYDLGNEFFRLWLDDSMTYSCALFSSPSDTLEEAQARKLDHSLAKLKLQAGETLLDIGCGWGSAIIRAAERYGVRCVGITLSEEQVAWASAEIARRGLGDRCEVRLENYLETAKSGETFDKVISIGMAEHVGQAYLGQYAEAVAKLTRPAGLAMMHCITRPPGTGAVDESSYSNRIFPGGYLPKVDELKEQFQRVGLALRQVENIGPNYAPTLDEWSKRFEAHVDKVREMYGEEFVRKWRLYLRGCAALFRIRTLDVHQFTLEPVRAAEPSRAQAVAAAVRA